jgi:hypothetical protein
MAQTDDQPIVGFRPTQTWQVGEEIEDHSAILRPADLPSSQYAFCVGMDLWPQIARVLVVEAEAPIIDNSIQLGSVLVLESGSDE